MTKQLEEKIIQGTIVALGALCVTMKAIEAANAWLAPKLPRVGARDQASPKTPQTASREPYHRGAFLP